MSANFLNTDFGDDDEDSGEDFNPQIEDASGDDEQNDRVNGSAKSSRPVATAAEEAARGAHGDGQKEQDGEEDDDGDGEDLGDDDRRSKRQKRGRRLNQFIEEEAEVDDDDDDMDADDDELGADFVQETHPDDELPAEADTDDRRHRELDRKRQLEASMDAEKQAQEFRERYGRRTTAALSNAAFVPQNLLMPDVNKDPKIWGIRCREGKERELVRKLMQKMLERAKTGKAMEICSVFERGEGSMRGYIFVEAFDKRNVDAALADVSDVYPRTKTNLVPIKEMPDLLRVNKSKELNPGDYVRIKRGLYVGDLGVVEDVVANGLEVTVKLVPRLTYGADDDVPRASMAGGEDAAKRKRGGGFGPGANPASRPPARLFSEAEAKKRHSRFLQSNRGLTGKSFTYRNDTYEDGFLIKEFRLQHLQRENVQPKLEETQMFTKTGQDGSETLDLETLKKSLHDNTTAESSYQVGDEVEVFAGEQKGIIGRTERTSGNIVSIKVTEGELRDQIVEVPVRSLHKRFREGDNVMVVGASKYRDQVGTVLLIKDDKVTILTQDSQSEITVFSRDLREASGVGASSERSKFGIRDLVLLTATSFGCVVSASPQSVMVMETTGEVTARLPSSLSTIELQRKQVSVDRMGQEIRVGDAVKQIGGDEHSGNIIHLYRNFLYAVDQSNMAENAGIWVSRCNAVVSRGGKAAPAGGIDMSKINPALKTGVNGGGAMLPPQRPGLDKLVRQRVKIRGGMFKGHRGIVRDTTAAEARVELEAKSKTVNIAKDHLVVLDGKNPDGKGTPYVEWARLRGGVPRMATGYGGGSRTPAWSSQAKTPYAADSGFGSSSARGDSAPTPGAGFGSGPVDAPTPGGYAKGASLDRLKYNHSLGGALAMDAPTPAANAPTPYAMDAPTPAAGGGPRYAEDDDDED
ncbi:hypothetical protein DV737_g5043, partial [Chaetothyriales sp. CBS 132003]